jgi:calcineurin-like phosphoesterase family protein
MDIWFSSDFHFNHKNIVRGTSEWGTDLEQQVRDFDTLEQHNERLIKNINACVKGGDALYFLGDWSFGGFESIRKLRERLYATNIHFVLGNHDHHIDNNKDEIRQLFSSVNQYINKRIGGQRMFLCHYAMRVWDKSHHGSWHLYGHSHGSLPDYKADKGHSLFKSMDVGIDTHPEFRPYHFDEIAEIMKNRIILQVDHHNRETN